MENKVAVITGSSRGIGKAIATELAQNGCTIVINGRNQERLGQAHKELLTIHDRVSAICCDVSGEEGAYHLINESIRLYDGIDILVNNVGVSMRGNLGEIKPEVVKTVFESNVYGTIFPTIAAIPHLRKRNGSIVFISSVTGIRGLPGLSAYSASKMSLRAFAESLRIEEHKNNIHVGLIYVGITKIVHNKETIAADGSKIKLRARTGKGVQSMESVAKAVVKNIQQRKFVTVLSRIGKINAFLQRIWPSLVEKIILRNLSKFEEKSK